MTIWYGPYDMGHITWTIIKQIVWVRHALPLSKVVAVSSSSEGEEEAKNEDVQIQNKIIGPKRKKGQSAKRVRTDSGVFCS